MKKILLLLAFVLPLLSYSQEYVDFVNVGNKGLIGRYTTDYGITSDSLLWLYADTTGSTEVNVKANRFYADCLKSANATSASDYIIYSDANGQLRVANKSTLGFLSSSTAASTYTPLTRSITINGTTQSLAADRTWTLTTTDISEGTNLYYTTARFNTGFSGKTTTDLAEGTNLYFTNARARSAISLTTTGTSGAATYNSSTGVLNIPQYTTGVTIGAPSAGNSITSGTAFQPNSSGPCNILINSSLGSGLAAVTGSVQIQMSATQNGTYTTVATDGMILSLLGATLDRASSTIPVPTGYWVKVNNSVTGVGATLTSTYTRWNL